MRHWASTPAGRRPRRPPANSRNADCSPQAHHLSIQSPHPAGHFYFSPSLSLHSILIPAWVCGSTSNKRTENSTSSTQETIETHVGHPAHPRTSHRPHPQRRARNPPSRCRAPISLWLRSRGPDGLARFLRLNRSGTGDYARDREQWQRDLTLDQILESIREHRQHPSR